MTKRTVEAVLPPPAPHMVGDGFRVSNFFPSGYNMAQDRLSPFFMLDYNAPVDFGPREEPRGVGVHPHRGFETVTFAFQGSVAHHDSAGHSGVINAGDVQWMTAGAGILHKEFQTEAFAQAGGVQHMLQLWINLPAKDKGHPARYQSLTKENIPVKKEGASTIRVLAGT